jgi:hypothetical protein
MLNNQSNNVVVLVLVMTIVMGGSWKMIGLGAWLGLADALVWHTAHDNTVPFHIGEMINSKLWRKSRQ